MTRINEKTWKNCIKMSDVASKAITGAITLDDKIRMTKLKRQLDEVNRIMKIICFEYEDAEKFAENTEVCGNCFSVVEK